MTPTTRRVALAALLLGAPADASTVTLGPGAEAGNADRLVATVEVGERQVKVLFAEPVVTMPEAIGSVRLHSVQPYDDPWLGTMYRYLDGAGTFIDVFVYPVPDTKLLEDDEALLDWIEADFRAGLEDAEERGIYRKVKFLDEQDLDLDPGERSIAEFAIAGDMPAGDLRHCTARFEHQGQRIHSELLAFGVQGLAVKIRRSEPDPGARREVALEFAQGLRATRFATMPEPPTPDSVYANRFLGLHGVIGASVRVQLDARITPAPAPAPATTGAAPAPSTAPPPP